MLKKGTIVYIGGFEMPDKNAAANRVMNNAKVLSLIGYDVVFCGVDKDIQEAVDSPQRIGIYDSWPSKYPTKANEWIKELMSFKRIKLILSYYKDIKFVVAYNMHAFPLCNLERWCKKNKIKVIIDSTEWYQNQFSLFPGKLIRWIDTNLAMKIFQKRADGVIAISSILRDYYSNSVDKVIQVPPLIDYDEKKWHKRIERNNDSTTEFTYTGRVGDGRGYVKDKIDLVIKAFARIPESEKFHFTVVGMTKNGFELCFPDEKKYLEHLGTKVEFCGRVSNQISVEKLLRADYCIFLRDKNRANMAGFPTKFVESLTCGTPLIVNDISNVRDYMSDDAGFLMNSIEVNSITDVILQCIHGTKIRYENCRVFDYRNYVNVFKKIF